MAKEILDMLKKIFDEHLSREFLISQGYRHICELGLITDEEDKEFASFLASHPHKIWSMKMLKEAGIPGMQELDDKLDEMAKKRTS